MNKVLGHSFGFDQLHVLVELEMVLVEDLSFEEDIGEVAIQAANHQRFQIFFAQLFKVDLLHVIVLLIDLDLQSVELVYKLLLEG